MSMVAFDKLVGNIEGLDADLGKGLIDVENIGGKSLIPTVKEAAKNLVKSRYPEMSKEQLDMMFDSEKELMDKEEEREKKRKEKEEQRALSKEQKKQISEQEKQLKRQKREENRRKRKEARKKRIKQYKEIYKNKIKEIKEEVKRILKLIKETLKKIFRDFIEIAKAIILLIIDVATFIVSCIVIIVAPPWNIPLAVNRAMKCYISFMTLRQRMQDASPWLKYLLLIPLVLGLKNTKIIAKIFNPIIKALRVFWKPINFLNEFITKAIKAIIDFLKRNQKRIFRRATRKLKKFGHLYKRWLINPANGKIYLPPKFVRGDYFEVNPEEGIDYPCYCFDEEDVEEVQGLLDTFICGFTRSKRRNRVIAYRRKISQEAKDIATKFGKDFPSEIDNSRIADEIDSALNQIEETQIADFSAGIPPNVGISDDTDIEEKFIYDMELPDGTIIQNISEEGIEYFRQTYVLKYINAFTQSIQEVSQTI